MAARTAFDDDEIARPEIADPQKGVGIYQAFFTMLREPMVVSYRLIGSWPSRYHGGSVYVCRTHRQLNRFLNELIARVAPLGYLGFQRTDHPRQFGAFGMVIRHLVILLVEIGECSFERPQIVQRVHPDIRDVLGRRVSVVVDMAEAGGEFLTPISQCQQLIACRADRFRRRHLDNCAARSRYVAAWKLDGPKTWHATLAGNPADPATPYSRAGSANATACRNTSP